MEGGRIPAQPAQQAHTLIKLTNIVHLYHYDRLHIHQLGRHVRHNSRKQNKIRNLAFYKTMLTIMTSLGILSYIQPSYFDKQSFQAKVLSL